MRHLWVLYVTSDIILVRSVFRVIKYLQGNDGYLIFHEIFLYVFDTILIAAVVDIFFIWHMGERCPRRKAVSGGVTVLVITRWRWRWRNYSERV